MEYDQPSKEQRRIPTTASREAMGRPEGQVSVQVTTHAPGLRTRRSTGTRANLGHQNEKQPKIPGELGLVLSFLAPTTARTDLVRGMVHGFVDIWTRRRLHPDTPHVAPDLLLQAIRQELGWDW